MRLSEETGRINLSEVSNEDLLNGRYFYVHPDFIEASGDDRLKEVYRISFIRELLIIKNPWLLISEVNEVLRNKYFIYLTDRRFRDVVRECDERLSKIGGITD